MHPRSAWRVAMLPLAAALCLLAASDDGGPDDAEAEAMRAWAAYATPGPQHAFLARKVGDWVSSAQMVPAPGAPPIGGTFTSSYTMEFGGRYLIERIKGRWMEMDFEAMGITGFDNGKQKFLYSWIDNIGTTITRGEGTLSEDGKVLTYFSEMYDPSTRISTTMRSTEEWIDEESMRAVMYATGPDGREFEHMVLSYRRAAATQEPAGK